MSYRNISDIKLDESIPIRVSKKYPNIVKVNNVPVKYIKRIPNKYKKNEKVLVYESGEISDATIKMERTQEDVAKKKNNNDTAYWLKYIDGYDSNMSSYIVDFIEPVTRRLINPLSHLRIKNITNKWDEEYIDKIDSNTVTKKTHTFTENTPVYDKISRYFHIMDTAIFSLKFYRKIVEIDNDKRIMYYIKPKYLTILEKAIPKPGTTYTITNSILSITSFDKPNGGQYNYILRDSAKKASVTYTVKELEWKTVTGTRTPPGSENNDSYTEDIYTREEKYVDGQPTGEYRNETITGSNQIIWKDEIEDRVIEEDRIDGGPSHTSRYPSRYGIDWNRESRRKKDIHVYLGKITEQYTKVTYRDYKKRKYINDIATNEIKLIRTEVVLRENVYWKVIHVSRDKIKENCYDYGEHAVSATCTIIYENTYGEAKYINDKYTGDVRRKFKGNSEIETTTNGSMPW